MLLYEGQKQVVLLIYNIVDENHSKKIVRLQRNFDKIGPITDCINSGDGCD